jgi:SAM-dependent methyltransferase
MLKWILAHPRTHDLDIDDPRTTHLRKQIIEEKPFLRKIYQDWYEELRKALPKSDGLTLELGSGAGFLVNFIPGLITSEMFFCPYVKIVLNGISLPFATGALRAIVITNVLHHISDPYGFFSEAARCVRKDGVVAMIEPWVSCWSKWVYGYLHHEPFHPYSTDFGFAKGGPLSGGNSALPWILFQRDRARFELDFPQWKIKMIRPIMPFRYLISGGVYSRNLMPGCMSSFWKTVEKSLQTWIHKWAMFALITLQRTNIP